MLGGALSKVHERIVQRCCPGSGSCSRVPNGRPSQRPKAVKTDTGPKSFAAPTLWKIAFSALAEGAFSMCLAREKDEGRTNGHISPQVLIVARTPTPLHTVVCVSCLIVIPLKRKSLWRRLNNVSCLCVSFLYYFYFWGAKAEVGLV